MNVPTPAAQPAASILIVVVERDPHIRQLEAHFLQEAGFTVHFAADGREALEHAQHRQPAIVITTRCDDVAAAAAELA